MSKPSALSTIIQEYDAEIEKQVREIRALQASVDEKRSLIARLKSRLKPRSKPRAVPSAKPADLAS